MICMIDNFDSFTYNIVNYIAQCGEEIDVFKNNDNISTIDFSKYDGIVLSPGPSSPDKSGISLDVLETIKNKPILGVCLGMQAIAYKLGGKVIHAKKTMHGKVDEIKHNNSTLFKNIPENFKAVRYHSLAVEKESLPETFNIDAYSSDEEIMAISHKEYPIWGVQFHPESYLTEHGKEIINNFIGACHDYKS